MEYFPYELLENIFEYALLDSTDAALRLSLVSKRFYSVAGPLRYRYLHVSGLKQLEEVISFVEKAQEYTGPGNIGIQHLFLCNYFKDHALLTDTETVDANGEDGMEVAMGYYNQHPVFWSKASHLLRLASPSLQTLYILDFSEYPDPTLYYNKKFTRYDDTRLLFALSSVSSYPELCTLVVKHDIRRADAILKDNTSWIRPNMPVLSYLSLKSQCLAGRAGSPSKLHPLLDGVHTAYPTLSHLAILGKHSYRFPDLMSILWGVVPLSNGQGLSGPHGDRVRRCIKDGLLPDNLKKAELCLGRSPTFKRWSGFAVSAYRDELQDSIQQINMRRVAGLEVVPFTPAYPNIGEREYELLLKNFQGGFQNEHR